ncbi:unnamed protein product [Cylindrotheca closterium]|uniref:Uncharacterized protein n=1 Tax=Cylindrotheca closterium TaxID=2856 RepID=A0AAD2FNL2_9STRA|nr:unnamed protein product [Cylindrotheca closterium]
MDGLDDRAQATLSSIVEQLYTSETVQVKHKQIDQRPIVARRLVLRSGISIQGLVWLQEALLYNHEQQKRQDRKVKQLFRIEALEVCSLQDTTVLAKVFKLCRTCNITQLTLTSYLSYSRGRHALVAQTIRSGLLGIDLESLPLEEGPNGSNNNNLGFYDPMTGQHGETQQALDRTRTIRIGNAPSTTNLEYLELRQYPIGAEGTKIMAAFPVCTATPTTSSSSSSQLKIGNGGLHTLKMIDCDLQSDCAKDMAKMIQYSTNLRVLDISDNRSLTGASLVAMEMFLKTLVKHGMQDNLSLVQVDMDGVDPRKLNRKRLNRHLDINRLLWAYSTLTEPPPPLEGTAESSPSTDDVGPLHPPPIPRVGEDTQSVYGLHPALFCQLLGRVSIKPAATYYFLQQNITTMFA